jgi:hypothetical protein
MAIRKLWVVCWKIKKKQQENELTSHLDAPWRCDQMICKAPTQYTAEPAQKLGNVHKWLTHSSVCRPVSIPPLKKHKGKIHHQFKNRRKTLKLTWMSFKIQLAFKHHDTGHSSLSYDGQRLYSTTNYFNTESQWKDSTKEERIYPCIIGKRPAYLIQFCFNLIYTLVDHCQDTWNTCLDHCFQMLQPRDTSAIMLCWGCKNYYLYL